MAELILYHDTSQWNGGALWVALWFDVFSKPTRHIYTHAEAYVSLCQANAAGLAGGGL